MKKHGRFLAQRESGTEAKPVRRDAREVMSELVAQLRKQLEEESVVSADKDKGVA